MVYPVRSNQAPKKLSSAEVANQQFFNLIFPFICDFIPAHIGYFNELAEDPQAQQDELVYPMLEAIFGLFWRRNRNPDGSLTPPPSVDEWAKMAEGNWLMSDQRNSVPLKESCRKFPRVMNALLALLFNPEHEEYYFASKQSITDFYLHWLKKVRAKDLVLLKSKLNTQQVSKIDWYLKELEYRKAKKTLVKWLNAYQASIKGEGKKAKPDAQCLYAAADDYTGSLLKILHGEAEYQSTTYEHRVRAFFIKYSERKFVLSDPYTKKLKTNLEKLWNWLRKRFGWAPAHRKLENSISENTHSLFKQEKTVYLLLCLVKEFIDGFRGDIRVESHFFDLQSVLKDVNKTSDYKVDYFRYFLRSKQLRFKEGEFNQEFVSAAQEILAGSAVLPPPVLS